MNPFYDKPEYSKPRDNCEICFGKSGGVPGNENVINGWVVCDYCHAKMLRNEIPEPQPRLTGI